VAVASAGPYANLHLAQTNNLASNPPLSFYRADALPATQPTVSKQRINNVKENICTAAIKHKAFSIHTQCHTHTTV